MTLDIEMKKEMETALKGQQFNNLIHRHIAEEYFELGWLDAKRSTMGAEPIATVVDPYPADIIWQTFLTDFVPVGTKLYTAPPSKDTKDVAIIEAAINLVKVKGRYHSEIAYKKLAEAVAAKEPK